MFLLSAGGIALVNAQSNFTDDDVYELSPFEVTTTEGTGSYAVGSTLAGSRLRADVKDIGAAITMISKEYLDDLGINDAQALADFLPSTEESNTHGSEIGSSGVFQTNAYVIRGLQSDAASRNYFSAPIGEYMPSTDGYNTSRMALSAGANSILFGSANPAGLINSQIVTAELLKDSYRLKHQTDYFGSQRFELAANKVVIEDKFAVRFHMLDDQKRTFRDEQYVDQRRFFGAVTYKPFENTKIQANFEVVDYEKNHPLPVVLSDFSNTWRASGMPTTVVDGSTNPTAEGIGRLSGANTTSFTFGANGQNLLNARNYAQGGFARIGVNSKNTPLPINFMDYDQVFGAPRLDDRKFSIGDFSIEQKISDNFYIQFAGFYNKHEKDIYWSGGDNALRADASATLPDGSVNPNAGSYWIGGGTVEKRDFKYENNNYRLTASYDLDLQEVNKWLGRHMISLMAQDNTGRRFTDRPRLVNTTPLDGYNANIFNGQNAIRPMFYVDPQNGDLASSNVLDVRKFPKLLSQDPNVNAEWVNRVKGINTETKQKIYMLAAQSYLLNDRLVFTAGYRIDKQDVYDVKTSDWTRESNGSWASYDDSSLKRTKNESISDVDEDTYSFGGVFHLLRERGAVDYLALTYNKSTNFQPSPADPNFQGNPRPFSTGDTKDFGIKFGVFDNKVIGKISRFESAQKNAKGSNFAFVRNGFNNIWDSLALYVDPSFEEKLLSGNTTDTTDIAAEGYEFEITYQPLPNWRVSFMASKNEAVRSNISPSALKYLAENRDEVLEYATVLMDGGEKTVGDVLADMESDMAYAQAQTGRSSNQMREWKFSALTNYSFLEGRLKGVNVGAYCKWLDEAIIGYGYASTGQVDISNPFYGPDLLDVGLHFGYKRKILNNKVDWKIQLNIRNLLNDDDALAVRADATSVTDNTPIAYSYRLVAPRSFVLSNTFSF